MLNKAKKKGGGGADRSRSPCLGFGAVWDLVEYLQHFVAVVLKIYEAEVEKKQSQRFFC